MVRRDSHGDVGLVIEIDFEPAAPGDSLVDTDELASGSRRFDHLLAALVDADEPGRPPPRHRPHHGGLGPAPPPPRGLRFDRPDVVLQPTTAKWADIVDLVVASVPRGGALSLAPPRFDPIATFDGRVRFAKLLWRRVELRVFPVGSGNVTLFELVPVRRIRRWPGPFLGAAVPSVAGLIRAVEARTGHQPRV